MSTTSFQNVNTISVTKIGYLSKYLAKSPLIFLSEINKANFSCVGAGDLFETHFPQDAPRLGLIASKLIDIKPVGLGLSFEQVRLQIDQTAVQTYIYKVNFGKTVFYIENVYAVPNLSRVNKFRLIDHLAQQALKYTNYVCGGDFNINWLLPANKDFYINVSSLIQKISSYTRVRSYKVRSNKNVAIDDSNPESFKTRTSKTLIDHIYVNSNADRFVTRANPVVISSRFDHKSVKLTLKFPDNKYYKEITYFKDPLNRPLPTEGQTQILLDRISAFDESELRSYDHSSNLIKHN